MRKLLINLALLSLGAIAFAGATLIPPMTAQAAADAAPAAAGIDWTGTVVLIGAVGLGLGAMLGGLAAILHALAARTRNATLEIVAKDVDLAHGKLDELLARGGIALADLQPRKPQSGSAFLGTLLVLTVLGVGAAIACTATQARQVAATGTIAALDCESAHLDAQVLADARTLADAEVQRWIGGAAPADLAALKARVLADLAPIKSDLGRCAVAGAIAAAGAVAESTPGLAISALSARPDPALVRAAFAVAVRELGWPAVRVAGGAVL